MKNIVIGSGIIGMSIANELRHKDPNSEILVTEKEQDVGKHASVRNSDVLHAGWTCAFSWAGHVVSVGDN